MRLSLHRWAAQTTTNSRGVAVESWSPTGEVLTPRAVASGDWENLSTDTEDKSRDRLTFYFSDLPLIDLADKVLYGPVLYSVEKLGTYSKGSTTRAVLLVSRTGGTHG